jgi:hypothetical protein
MSRFGSPVNQNVLFAILQAPVRRVLDVLKQRLTAYFTVNSVYPAVCLSDTLCRSRREEPDRVEAARIY